MELEVNMCDCFSSEAYTMAELLLKQLKQAIRWWVGALGNTFLDLTVQPVNTG